jgi:hypothetical protein
MEQYIEQESKQKDSKINFKQWTFDSTFDPDSDEYPQQKNKYDCGIFMMKYATNIMDGISLKNMQEENMHFVRNDILETILKDTIVISEKDDTDKSTQDTATPTDNAIQEFTCKYFGISKPDETKKTDIINQENHDTLSLNNKKNQQ